MTSQYDIDDYKSISNSHVYYSSSSLIYYIGNNKHNSDLIIASVVSLLDHDLHSYVL